MKHAVCSTLQSLTLVSVLAAASAGIALAQPPASPPTTPAAQPADAPAPKERIAAIKKSFAQSQAMLRTYEWIETTSVSLKGEEKSNKQNRCYYGAEGTVQKVPVAPAPEAKPERGIRGKIKEQKKEELAEYMEEAAALVHKYLPPDQAKLQKCADAGKVTIHMVDPDKRAKIDFRDYLQSGDVLSVDINLADNTILGVSVTSALSSKDPVTLDVKFDKFPDGTIYTAQTKLAAKAKSVEIVVTNGGYRKTGS